MGYMILNKLQMKSIVTYLAMLFLLSCETQTPLDFSDGSLDGKINIRFMESFGNHNQKEAPKLYLDLKTDKHYPHTGYTLLAEMSVTKSSIDIDINGIKNWGSGGDAFSPAGWWTVLDIPNASYRLNIRDRTQQQTSQIVDSYILRIDENSISIEDKEQSFTRPFYNFYWRYPKKSFACKTESLLKDSLICKIFQDSLEKIIQIEQFDFPDQGVRPYPSSYIERNRYCLVRYFWYKNDADLEKAGDFLKNFTQDVLTNYEALNISLYSWNNVEYLSWMFD
jgi:hypothetical protein